MTLRILRLLLCALTLLVIDGCAKRENQATSPAKPAKDAGDESADAEKPEDGSADTKTPDIVPDGQTKDGSAEEEPESYPAGLTKEQYEEGKKRINGWDGLTDNPDPTGKWSVRRMPNPSALADSLGNGTGTGAPTGQGVTLAQVRPIIQNACASCHNVNGSRASSPMTTDEQIMLHFDGIKSRVRNGSMPPNGGLPQQERDLIAAWTKENAAGGQQPQQQQQQQQQQPFGNSGLGGL